MLRILPLARTDIETVCELAREIWQSTYLPLISQAQIDFMLADRYAPEVLHDQMDDPRHIWRLALWKDEIAGFAHGKMDGTACKLEKLYVRPGRQHQGLGASLMDEVKQFARNQNAARLRLQVNRGNTQAISAYQKYGFSIVGAQVFDIGGGFVMDDYVMEMTL